MLGGVAKQFYSWDCVNAWRHVIYDRNPQLVSRALHTMRMLDGYTTDGADGCRFFTLCIVRR